MKYLSVCSGIEAATMAWHVLGWEPIAFSEIEPFPCAVLEHHYPHVPNWGDMTKFEEWPDANFDVLCGGTPCQSFSVAGLRKGLDDPRGNLMLTFAAIAAKYRPRWVVWENVPGVLSSSGGRDFASLLGILSGRAVEPPAGGWQNTGVIPGIDDAYGLAWRVLDAQYVRVDGYGRAVPQRRRRVFLVGHLGDWRRAAAVLLERESLRGNPPPRREAGARVAATLTRGAESSGRGGYAGRRQEDDYNIVAFGGNNTAGPVDVATACNAHGGTGRLDFESETFVAYGFQPRIARNGRGDTGDIVGALNAHSGQTGKGDAAPCVAIGFHGSQDPDVSGDVTHPAGRNYGLETCAMYGSSVRRLTPRECERLQGFPDDFTLIERNGKPAQDGPRYKAIGNSWAVNCARWIGRRIERVEGIE